MLIEKRGRHLDLQRVDAGEGKLPAFDVMYTTRLQYLRNSLAQRYGNEILFVGSGGIFRIRRPRSGQQEPAPRSRSC